jgi:hypothetical protein
MVFNSRASFIACLLVSVLTCILRITQVLPDELWTACFGHIAFPDLKHFIFNSSMSCSEENWVVDASWIILINLAGPT